MKPIFFAVLLLVSCNSVYDYSNHRILGGMGYPNYCGEDFTGVAIEYLDSNLNPTERENAIAYRYVHCWNSKLVKFPTRGRRNGKLLSSHNFPSDLLTLLDGTYELVGREIDNPTWVTQLLTREEYQRGYMISQMYFNGSPADTLMVAYFDWKQGIGQYTLFRENVRVESYGIFSDGTGFNWKNCFQDYNMSKGVPPPDTLEDPLPIESN